MTRRVLAPLVLVALVATACGEPDGVSFQANDATTSAPTTSVPAVETTAGLQDGSTTTPSTSTTIANGGDQSSGSARPDESTTTTSVDKAPASVPETTIPPPTGEGPASLVDQIIADAAGRAGVATSEVTVIRSEAVVWNDGSLGCPQPGVAYTQALVDGYWIVVEAAGTEYDYRATSGGSFKLCEMPTPGGSGTDR